MAPDDPGGEAVGEGIAVGAPAAVAGFDERRDHVAAIDEVLEAYVDCAAIESGRLDHLRRRDRHIVGRQMKGDGEVCGDPHAGFRRQPQTLVVDEVEDEKIHEGGRMASTEMWVAHF